MRVQESDGFENETVAESGCSGPDAPKPLLREQWGEQCVVKVGGVSDDVMGSTDMVFVCDVLNGCMDGKGKVCSP